MRICQVQIENYRSIESATIDFDSLTAIVGRNGAGKSTVLNALALFYSLSTQVTEHDYFNCDMQRQIRIRVTYDSLTRDELTEFSSYVTDGKLSVSKTITTGGSTYKGTRLQINEFASIRRQPFRVASSELKQLIESAKYPGLSGSPRSQEALNELLDTYETNNPSLRIPIESEGQFLGPTNVGGGKLDKYTKFVRIPAVRDASGELDRKGAILQLLDVLVLRSISARPEVRKLNEELEEKIREIYSKQNISELGKLAESITTLLRRYAPGAALELDFGAVAAPKVPAPQPIAALVEDDFRCPVSHTGHGLQRALIFALLEQLARTEAAIESQSKESSKREEDSSGITTSETPAPSLILAIEEPELYLHPPRSRFLARTLLNLSQSNGPSTQVCYTTHSPFYVGLDRFDQIRMARKSPADSASLKRTVYHSFSRGAAAASLQEISQEKREFSPDSFVVRASPVMTSAVNEGFFADAVVVVEGMSDAAALGALQDILGKQWDEKGIVVVPALGKANLDRPTLVFRGFGIPTYFVFDGDSDCKENEKVDTIRKNRHLLRLAGAAEMDFPETTIERSWAVFGKNLETELKSVDPDFFTRERTQLAQEFGYTESKNALKNPELTALYIQRAHKAGKLPESLRLLVEAVSRLVDDAQRNGTVKRPEIRR
jgi:putative ATP-dependent endonuclease of OLD family